MAEDLTEEFKIEIRPIESVIPYDKNPRINDKAVDAVAASLQEFGFRQPIVVDSDGVVIVGHTRLKAAQKLGLTSIPVHVAVDLTPEQIQAYRIADNKTGEIAEWDFEILPIELSELQDSGFDMSVLGFSEKELTKLLETDLRQGLTDPDAVPEPPDDPVTQKGDLWILGNHRLLCGDSAKEEDVDYLLDGAIIDLCNTDPPYNVRVEPRSNNAIAAGVTSFTRREDLQCERSNSEHGKKDRERIAKKNDTPKKMRAKDRPLENDFMSDEAFAEILNKWFGNISRVLKPGGSAYIWGGYANLANYPPALANNGLYFSQCLVWDKQHPVLTRKDFMGAYEICQPPDTMVATPDGDKPICELKDGDEVIAFAQHSSAIVGYRNGPKVRVAARDYTGDLYEIVVGDKRTRCTDGHIFSVKLVPHAHDIWCIYLMKRGSWWRVGKSRLLTTWGLGIKQRLEMENADAVWVLSTRYSNSEAMCEEQRISVQYGIPTTFWECKPTTRRTNAQIEKLYAQLDLEKLNENALQAIDDHHRHVEFPFIISEKTRVKHGRRISFDIRVCNILPEAMMVPVPTPERQHFKWTTIDSVNVTQYSGKVYSLDVEKYHHYVADGIVTHNCFYSWKEGAGHKFFGPNNVSDLWSVKKVNPQNMVHLTEKPVELAVRAIQYSSKPGENVLELFGGSGSTLMACEQTDRKCFAMEIDQLYCDVIVKRWAEFTGRDPVRITRDGDQKKWSELTAETLTDE